MRWPWSRRPERREAVGGYTALVERLIGAQAAGTTQQASATAGTEAAAGLLSRAFASATVEAPADIAAALSPRCLSLIGRDLIRVGESLHVIRMTGGRLQLIPCSTWYWEGDADPRGWTATVTAYGPSGSSTWRVPWDSVVHVTWGAPTARPYHGLSPQSWAADTARLNANAERSLANEAAGPVAQLVPVPQGPSDPDSDSDPLTALRQDIADAKGRALVVETTQAGWDQGRVAAPQGDWKQQRLGPQPPEAMVRLAESAFNRVLAAAGVPPSLFVANADGTAQREALRRWHQNVVLPMARGLESELSDKFGVPVGLEFDSYPLDMVSRAQVVSKLVQAGVDPGLAMGAVGLD